MAYMPVEFNLSEFGLLLNSKAAGNFHKRMKELGFDAHDSKGMMIYTRHDSRICAMIGSDMSLNFLQDFYDHTPGGTIYAILERLVMNFGGTMIGTYSIPSAGKSWGVRVKEGLNLSGRDDVGQRDMVQEEEVQAPAGAATPSSSAAAVGGNSYAQAVQATAQTGAFAGAGQVNHGQVPNGIPGPAKPKTKRQLQRDKLYQFMVEDQYSSWVATNGGGDDANKKLELIRKFQEEFPEEKEVELQTQEDINFFETLKNEVQANFAGGGMPGLFDGTLYSVEYSDLAYVIADDTGYDEEEAEVFIAKLADISVAQGWHTEEGGVHSYSLRNIKDVDDFELCIRAGGPLHSQSTAQSQPTPAAVTQQPSPASSQETMQNPTIHTAPTGWDIIPSEVSELVLFTSRLVTFHYEAGAYATAKQFLGAQETLITLAEMKDYNESPANMYHAFKQRFKNQETLAEFRGRIVPVMLSNGISIDGTEV